MHPHRVARCRRVALQPLKPGTGCSSRHRHRGGEGGNGKEEKQTISTQHLPVSFLLCLPQAAVDGASFEGGEGMGSRGEERDRAWHGMQAERRAENKGMDGPAGAVSGARAVWLPCCLVCEV